MTQTEATEKILTEKNNKRAAAAELKSSLERVPAFYTTETVKGEQQSRDAPRRRPCGASVPETGGQT